MAIVESPMRFVCAELLFKFFVFFIRAGWRIWARDGKRQFGDARPDSWVCE
jgi:hypothetical protein